MAPPTVLTTAADVVSVLGGTRAVMILADASFPQVVTNWTSRNRFAHSTYLVLISALRGRGYDADPMLWGIMPAERQFDRDAERVSG